MKYINPGPKWASGVFLCPDSGKETFSYLSPIVVRRYKPTIDGIFNSLIFYS